MNEHEKNTVHWGFLPLHIIATFKSLTTFTARKMKFSINDFFSKYDHIRSKLRIWSHLLKKSLMENFIFCAVLKLGDKFL